MKNTLETKSATSDRDDGCPKISHTPGVGGNGRSPVLTGGLTLSPRILLQQPQRCKTGTKLQPWHGKAGKLGGGLVPRLVLTCGTDFS